MQNVSGYGTTIRIVGLATFPVGFTVSQFADDVDPIAIEDVEPTGYDILLDGTVYPFQKGVAIRANVSVIPGGSDDYNLRAMLINRKSVGSLIPIEDTVILTITYKDGSNTIYSNGTILSGPLSDSIVAAGRHKCNTYGFVFSDVSSMNAPLSFVTSAANFVSAVV